MKTNHRVIKDIETNTTNPLEKVYHGVITKGVGSFYDIMCDELKAPVRCKGRGRLKHKDGILLVGDEVNFSFVEGNHEEYSGIIISRAKRRNEFIRPPIANVDLLLLVVAAKRPAPNHLMMDRFLVQAEIAGVDVCIIINKMDQMKEAIHPLEEIYSSYKVLKTSTKTGDGMDALLQICSNKKVALSGPSGVGKSSILNYLLKEQIMEVGDISKKSRGKHTTRHVEIFRGPLDSLIFDTPGFTSFDSQNLNADDVKLYYREFLDHMQECRFSDCMHIMEPSCGIKNAVKEGKIHQERYNNYLQMVELLKTGKYK